MLETKSPHWLSVGEYKYIGEEISSKEGDPIIQCQTGWYYNDEVWCNLCGPFLSREEAQASLDDYTKNYL